MLICFFRSIILYLLLILTIRLMGKRQVGEMEPSEFVVALVIADLAAIPMQDVGIPLLSGVIPILTILGMELLLSMLSYTSVTFRKLLCGKPVILMENGKILFENLRKTRLTTDELTEHLREKEIVDLSTVQYAILETNGEISTLLYPQHSPASAKDSCIQVDSLELPITIISNSKVLSENLQLAGRTEAWVQETLGHYGCTTAEVLLLTVTASGKLYLARKQEGA